MEKHQLRQDVGRLGGGISTERWHVVVQMQFLAFFFFGNNCSVHFHNRRTQNFCTSNCHEMLHFFITAWKEEQLVKHR